MAQLEEGKNVPVVMEPFVVNELKFKPVSTGNTPLIKFYSTAQRLGFARDNLFRLINISSLNLKDDEKLIYFKSATLPSRSIKTSKLYYQSFGFNIPFAMTYPESANWKVTFYSDKNYLIKALFDNWSKNTFNEQTFTRADGFLGNIEFELCKFNDTENINSTDGKKPTPNTIKDERTIKIGGPSLTGVKGQKYKLIGCFPTTIGSINYSSTGSGNIVSLDINIAYQYIQSG